MEEFAWLINLIQVYGYWVVAVGIFLECMGVPFPGETVLVLGGVAASLGHLELWIVILLATLAAVMGDNMGYALGKKYGRKIIKKFEHFPIFHYSHIEKAEKFFKKHGNKTVFLGRFTAILRTYSALFAGILNMPWRSFFFYNMTGGAAWAIIFGCLGYIIGNNLPLLAAILMNLNYLFIILVSCLAIFIGVKIFIKRKKV